uniref:Uncharacterized protein n=1 Tax=Rhizophora mucronata TaxID=61149 RepID=A0A2P2NVJ4_RHIMU
MIHLIPLILTELEHSVLCVLKLLFV